MIATADFQVTEQDFRTVREVVYKHCGISLGDEKQAMVKARLAKQIRAGGFSSAAAYLEHALADRSGEAFTELIDAIATNLTSFFREKEHFEYLSDVAMPALLKQKAAAGDGRLLVWSAACSSGEEPYSIGITLLESIKRCKAAAQKIDVRILATDISTQILAKARAGVYGTDRTDRVPAQYREKYFPDGVVSEELSSLVRFRYLNLQSPWPFKGPFDFIFCRNVMIYFDAATQQTLVNRMWDCLRPGGILFTGHSESLTRISHRFHNRRASIYEKSM